MPELIDNAITPARRHLRLTSDCPDFSAQAHEFTGDERATVSLLALNEATRPQQRRTLWRPDLGDAPCHCCAERSVVDLTTA